MRFPILDDRSWGTAVAVPADAVAVVAFVVVFDVVALVPPFSETFLRPLLALPLLFFVPGYALVAMLFPRRGETAGRDLSAATDPLAGRRLDPVERVALSFGASVLLLPLLALALSVVAWPLPASTIAMALGGVAVLAMGVATVRRWRLPPEARFRVPYERWLERGRAGVTGRRRDVLLNVALAGAVVVATGGFAYALAVPNDAATYTGFALLTEDASGDLVASGYPSELVAGEPTELVVGIENQEGEPVEYTVVVVLERVDAAGEDVTVLERQRIDRFTTTVQPGETSHQPHEVVPSMTGEDLRLSYYLYKGDPPAEPSAASADRHLFIWVDVSAEA